MAEGTRWGYNLWARSLFSIWWTGGLSISAKLYTLWYWFMPFTSYFTCIFTTEACVYGEWGYDILISAVQFISPLHVRLAGSGIQVPLADIPSDVQSALIVPAGTYPEAHMKDITAPTSVLEIFTMKPFRGAVGIPQLTGRKKVMTVVN